LLSGHFRRLFQRGQFGRMIGDAFGYLGAEGRFSRLYVRTRLRRWFGKQHTPQIESWLNPDFVRRAGLRERWEALLAETETNQSVRPEAHASVAARQWTSIFEPFDPAFIGYRVESCHPFFDLRVLKFLLALPALPWSSDKELLRQVERGVLPDAVRLRKKSPLMRDPIVALLQKPDAAWVDTFEAVPELREYVQRDRIPRVYQVNDAGAAWSGLKPLSLNFWLQRRAVSDRAVRETTQSYESVVAAG
jgi:asparagine synthase (glutamine-hydrolysing)